MLQIFKKVNVIPNFPTMKTNSNCLLFNHNQLNLLLPYGGNTHLTTQYYNDNSHLPTMSYSDSIGLLLTLPPPHYFGFRFQNLMNYKVQNYNIKK